MGNALSASTASGQITNIWSQPMYTMVNKLSNITDKQMSEKHLEHTLKIFGGTDEARVTLGLPLPYRTGFAFAIAYRQQGHSVYSHESWTPLKHFWSCPYEGKKDSRWHNSKKQIPWWVLLPMDKPSFELSNCTNAMTIFLVRARYTNVQNTTWASVKPLLQAPARQIGVHAIANHVAVVSYWAKLAVDGRCLCLRAFAIR